MYVYKYPYSTAKKLFHSSIHFQTDALVLIILNFTYRYYRELYLVIGLRDTAYLPIVALLLEPGTMLVLKL